MKKNILVVLFLLLFSSLSPVFANSSYYSSSIRQHYGKGRTSFILPEPGFSHMIGFGIYGAPVVKAKFNDNAKNDVETNGAFALDVFGNINISRFSYLDLGFNVRWNYGKSISTGETQNGVLNMSATLGISFVTDLFHFGFNFEYGQTSKKEYETDKNKSFYGGGIYLKYHIPIFEETKGLYIDPTFQFRCLVSSSGLFTFVPSAGIALSWCLAK